MLYVHVTQKCIRTADLSKSGLVPRPCAFVACSTKFAQSLSEFRTASDEHAGSGNEAGVRVCNNVKFETGWIRISRQYCVCLRIYKPFC